MSDRNFTPLKLDATQERLWSETRVALQWVCPAFTHVFYSLMDAGTGTIAVFTKDVPIAATDGSSLLLNPDTFFKYPIMKRVFICLHEIGHAMFDHCGQGHKFSKTGKVPTKSGKPIPYDHQTMNVATDLVINDMLIASKCGQFDDKWLHDTKLATHKDSAIDVYAKIYRDGKGPSGGGDQFDEHLAPGQGQGKQPHEAPRDEQEWKTTIAAGAAAAKAQGKLPAEMELFIDQLLNPEVDWTDKVQAFFARKVGSGGYDWRRADRRLVVRDIYSPGRSGFGAGTIAFAIDTSGSIVADPRLLQRFFSEMAGILEDLRPQRLLVMWIDARVHSVEEIEEASDLRTLKPKGGGGTDFRPAFDWIAKNDLTPDALIYLTDGDGSFPQRAPSYPVLWGNITPRYEHGHYPFGDVVPVPTPK
jgi:predicted metal-dependent peptidase